MKKFVSPKLGPKLGFAIFSRFHHYFSLVLHKIAAWDNIKHLVELKPQKKKKKKKSDPNWG